MRLEFVEELSGLPQGVRSLLARMGDAVLRAEGLSGRYQATVVITDDEGIQAINQEQRGLCAPTDVLSFPTVRYADGMTARHSAARLRRELDAETGHMHLGDMVISLPRAREQAEAYGHAATREVAFLFVHAMLHLLGYDHMTDDQRAVMRAMEEAIMDKTGISRTLTDADFALAEAAREAMAMAYAPYSHYKVGAAVRDSEGRVFKGCNVENASYGMTICAERNAMTTAVTEGMRAIEAIAIAAEGTQTSPCGACRQFMREFARDMKVILVTGDSIQVTTLQTLLPDSFGPESLEEVNA